MVSVKHIAVTALILVALIGGLGMVTAAEKRGETPLDKTNAVMKTAIDVCGASAEEQAALKNAMDAAKAIPFGSPTAKYGMWTNTFSMVSMGNATPGHVWGGNGQNDSIEIWYTHTTPTGGTFAGVRTPQPIGKGVGQTQDEFCGTWNYNAFTMHGYADQPPVQGLWWVWWN